jgi:hypothetical protein
MSIVGMGTRPPRSIARKIAARSRSSHRLAAQVLIDGRRRDPSRGHGADRHVRTEHRVAAGEDAGQARGERALVRGNPPAGRVQALALGQRPVHRLPDRRDHGSAVEDELRTGDRHGAPAPRGVGLPELHSPARQQQAPVPGGGEARRRHERVERRAFRLGGFDLVHQAGHLVARSAVQHAHPLRAEAEGGAGAVHGGVASADHDHVGTERRGGALGASLEEPDPRDRVLLSLAAETDRPGRSDRQQHGIVLLPQPGEGEVPAPALVHPELGSEGADHVDLRVERVLGQPERRDPVAEHAARLGLAVQQRAGVPGLKEEPGRGQPRRSGADDRDGAARCRGPRRHVGTDRRAVLVRGVPVQRADGQALVALAPAARLLAEARADPPDRAGQGEPVGDALHAAPSVAGRDLVDESGDVQARRAPRRARRDALAGVVRQQQLEGHLPRPAQILAVGRHDHALVNRHGARRRERAPSLHLHRAQEA